MSKDIDPWLRYGGPAFPANDGGSGPTGEQVRYRGMSMRDWFAGQALAGMMAACAVDGAHWKAFAQDAYAAADAMLAVRETDKKA